MASASRMARRAGAAPFRFFGAAADLTKQWVLKPAAIVIGVIFFLQAAIAALFGGMGGSSAAAVILLDTEEHFDNPVYGAPEEVGFQQRYEQSQAQFQAQIDGITGGYAKTLNKKGERIPYGVNGANNPEGNRNQDYKNGVTLRFDSEMRFAPYLYGESYIPDEDHMCQVDRKIPGAAFEDYAGCQVTGTCYHNTGDEEDNFGRRKPSGSVCSKPEPYWDCGHSCSSDNCSHDCSRSSIGCGGYWYCGGHDHYGCPEGHEMKACFDHVDMEMNIHMKSLEELFELGGLETEGEE